MKNKFDLVYESVVDEIMNKAKVDYQLNDDFKNQIIDELNHLKETESDDAIKSYLEFVYNKKVKRSYPLFKDDRFNALNEACKEVLNKELKDIIEIK